MSTVIFCIFFVLACVNLLFRFGAGPHPRVSDWLLFGLSVGFLVGLDPNLLSPY